MTGYREEATRLAREGPAGHPRTAARLFTLVYDELRAIAASYMRRERADNSLQPTELVHEACLRLIDLSQIDWQGRTHVLAVAARQMRRVLVDRARRRASAKRGARPLRVSLNEAMGAWKQPDFDVLDLHQALTRLERLSPRQSDVVTLRFFGGLSDKEVAEALRVSERTVRQDWTVAKAWLARELSGRRTP